MVVFAIPHFPFLGFLTVLLLIAIAADDVFILYDAYEQAKEAHPDKDITHWMAVSLEHGALSILVTSLTTGAALFANVVSDITDIKAFGIISGTAIIVNYVLVVTWMPAAIIAIEKIDSCCFSKVKCCECFEKFLATLKNISLTIFHKFLPACVSKLWFIWLILFLGLGIGGIVVTFIKPKLELPSSQDFALFSKDSVIEVWFQDVKYKFRFYQRANEERLGSGMALIALWGVEGDDTGNHLDPDSTGDLKFDSSFDLSQPDSQTWMFNFCQALKSAPFIDKEEIQRQTCSLDTFHNYLNTSCSALQARLGAIWKDDFSSCCGIGSFPLDSKLFKKCYYYFTGLQTFLNSNDNLGTAGYGRGTTQMKAYGIVFRSTQGWVANFQTMEKFYKETQDWMKKQLETAPSGLKEGWMTSRYQNFDLYDLQSSLASGTYEAIGVSMALGFVVMLVTSLNVLITLFAMFTIFLIISVCAGILVLLGWELNIVESVTLTMSVGLSIDFCIHYGMGYRVSTLFDRKLRVHESFKKVGAAIFMAAGTTFIAGACVMPSIVLFYVQLGTFLMLVMAFSWLFSTFFFQSLCYVIGPNGNFCQIPSPCQKCKSDETEADAPSPSKVNPTHNGFIPADKNDWSAYSGKQNPAYEAGPGDDEPPEYNGHWSGRERTFTEIAPW